MMLFFVIAAVSQYIYRRYKGLPVILVENSENARPSLRQIVLQHDKALRSVGLYKLGQRRS